MAGAKMVPLREAAELTGVSMGMIGKHIAAGTIEVAQVGRKKFLGPTAMKTLKQLAKEKTKKK